MSQLCPHCGARNFSISSVCVRCEGALKVKVDPPLRRATVPLADPVDVLEVDDNEDNAATVVQKMPSSKELEEAHTVVTVAPSSFGDSQAARNKRKANVPPPGPPPVVAVAEFTPAPIGVPKKRTWGTSGRGPRSPEGAEVKLLLSSWPRVAIAQFIDLLVVVSIGLAVTVLEGLVFGQAIDQIAGTKLDWAAFWVHANPRATMHGVIAAFIAGGAYSLLAARRSGRTLGHMATGTVLIRKSGKTLSWWFLGVRSFLGIISAALCGAGFFWAFVDGQYRTFHDMIMGAAVVRRRVRYT